MPFGLTRSSLHPGLAPRRVGLMGGSFNPPHSGHLHLAQEALKRLGLDQVWWLVSPQNPMKPSDDMRPFDERFYACEQMVASDRRIRVSDFEDVLDLQMSADTVEALKQAFPQTDFVWIMGADIMEELHLWEQASEFVSQVSLAVFGRPSYVIPALNSPMTRRLPRYHGPAISFMDFAAPAWTYVNMPMRSASSSAIRAQAASAQSAVAAMPKARKRVKGVDDLNPEELRDLVVARLEDVKVEDLNVVDMEGRSSIADYMVIGSGRASTHVKAMSEHVQQAVKDIGQPAINVAGQGNGDWVLIDAGDVVVHLFRPEVREFYQLDKLWDPELISE